MRPILRCVVDGLERLSHACACPDAFVRAVARLLAFSSLYRELARCACLAALICASSVESWSAASRLLIPASLDVASAKQSLRDPVCLLRPLASL